MKKIVKIFALIFALIIVVSCLTGCKTSEISEDTSNTSVEFYVPEEKKPENNQSFVGTITRIDISCMHSANFLYMGLLFEDGTYGMVKENLTGSAKQTMYASANIGDKVVVTYKTGGWRLEGFAISETTEEN